MGTAGDPSELIRKFSDPDLKELQLVANAVKHGDGKAHRQLKSMKAAVVDPTRVDNDWTVGEFSALTIALSVNAADIVRYRDAVLRFWSTRAPSLRSELDSMDQRRALRRGGPRSNQRRERTLLVRDAAEMGDIEMDILALRRPPGACGSEV